MGELGVHGNLGLVWWMYVLIRNRNRQVVTGFNKFVVTVVILTYGLSSIADLTCGWCYRWRETK